jgi:hypothetical protein
MPRMQRAPAVQLVGAVDVDRHRVGGVGPGVLAVVAAAGFFLEVELLDRVGLGAVGQARQEARHRQAQVARVVGLAQRAPTGVLGRGEDLGQVARVGQFLPRAHLHQRGAGRGDERRMRRGADLAHLAEELDVGRALVEVVVADQAAEGLAAELAVFLFVDLLEERALVPGRALEALERLAQVGLRDVHHADLQHLVGFGVVDEVVQAAPGALELLEVGVVQDRVDLLRQLAVELGDHGLDRQQHVAADQLGVATSACCASVSTACSTADLASSLLGLNSLFSSEEKVVAFEGHALQGGCGVGGCVGHGGETPVGSWVQVGSRAAVWRSQLQSRRFGLGAAAASDFSSASSLITLAISSSAPVLPSM